MIRRILLAFAVVAGLASGATAASAATHAHPNVALKCIRKVSGGTPGLTSYTIKVSNDPCHQPIRAAAYCYDKEWGVGIQWWKWYYGGVLHGRGKSTADCSHWVQKWLNWGYQYKERTNGKWIWHQLGSNPTASVLRPAKKSSQNNAGIKHALANIYLGRTDEHIIVVKNNSHAPARAWIRCEFGFGHGLTRYKNYNASKSVTGTGPKHGYSYVKCGKMTVGLQTVGGQVYQWGWQVRWYPGTKHPWKTAVAYTFSGAPIVHTLVSRRLPYWIRLCSFQRHSPCLYAANPVRTETESNSTRQFLHRGKVGNVTCKHNFYVPYTIKRFDCSEAGDAYGWIKNEHTGKCLEANGNGTLNWTSRCRGNVRAWFVFRSTRYQYVATTDTVNHDEELTSVGTHDKAIISQFANNNGQFWSINVGPVIAAA